MRLDPSQTTVMPAFLCIPADEASAGLFLHFDNERGDIPGVLAPHRARLLGWPCRIELPNFTTSLIIWDSAGDSKIAFERALALHKAGKFAEAKACFATLLLLTYRIGDPFRLTPAPDRRMLATLVAT